ncbi:hypothetical protein F5883DRAFT_677296 [Diaporthe sp. PMI_573]|nr:hypothetical protein F5883DRAFT_677296 [Diaporthaceae sp. PMI_573]
MGNGFLFCLTQTRTGLQKAMRYTAIATCVILAMLTIALFGVYNAQYSQYLNSWYGHLYEDALYVAGSRMSSALNFLTFFWALALLAFAAVVFHKTKRNYVLKNSAMLFLIAAVLNLITRLYMLIYISIFVLSNFYDYDRYETITALFFVDPIINVWIFVAVASLVCTILIRKRNGLWTTLQPWMDAQGPPALAANPSYKSPGEQWQQPSNGHALGV